MLALPVGGAAPRLARRVQLIELLIVHCARLIERREVPWWGPRTHRVRNARLKRDPCVVARELQLWELLKRTGRWTRLAACGHVDPWVHLAHGTAALVAWEGSPSDRIAPKLFRDGWNQTIGRPVIFGARAKGD